MVGKTQSFNFHSFTKKFRKSTSQLTTPSYKEDENLEHQKRSVPFIGSPLDPKATEWLRKKHQTGNLTLKRRPTIAQFEADRFAGGIFRKQHEASTLELFFDLFFVANLAVFTANHEHVSPGSVGNYVGFFSILWFTWFQHSIFDVRFYVDSLFNRFCKMVTFGIFVAFTGLGPVYDSIMYGSPTRAFHALALVLMVSRFLLLLQHASVLWFVRPFRKTVLPVSLLMLVYFCSAMAFLGTYLDDRQGSVDSQKGLIHVIIWYCIIAVEALAVIIISSIWRILSFKYTHLVERVGLLSLIVMGEGIIGLTKSVSYLLSGTNISIWSIVGKVVAAVMLIYEVYLLYFSPIDHDRFGTIRQQFWTLLHFPLHVAFLLAEEGSAVTLLWDASMRARAWLRDTLPDLTTPSTNFNSTTEWITSVNDTMNEAAYRYHYVKLKDTYDWYPDLNKVKNLTAPFGSSSWDEQVSEILDTIFTETTNFFFENFNFEMSKKTEKETDPHKKLQASYDAYKTVYTFFFAASGAILLLLALMYIIGKRGKSKEEYAAIITRIIVGVGLPCAIIAVFVNPVDTGIVYTDSGWVIAIVTFAFLLVVLIDNQINKWVDKKLGNYEEGDDDSHLEKGHSHTRSGPDGHRYGAIHGGHVDAQSAALHFGKPASFAHAHETHHSGGSHEHSRGIETDEHAGENTPFVAAGDGEFPLPATLSHMATFASDNSNNAANATELTSGPQSRVSSPQQKPSTLAQISTSYVPYHVPNPQAYAAAAASGGGGGGGNRYYESNDIADSNVRGGHGNGHGGVQLYEPTMDSPVAARGQYAGHGHHHNEA